MILYIWKKKNIWNADGLSRLPLSDQTEIRHFIYLFNLVNDLPLNADDIKKESNKDLFFENQRITFNWVDKPFLTIQIWKLISKIETIYL